MEACGLRENEKKSILEEAFKSQLDFWTIYRGKLQGVRENYEATSIVTLLGNYRLRTRRRWWEVNTRELYGKSEVSSANYLYGSFEEHLPTKRFS